MTIIFNLYRNTLRNNRLDGAYQNGNAPPWVVAGDPVILFSDLISAPRTGWSAAEPNKGAAVSIWGFNFGSFSAGNTYITIGDVAITEIADFPSYGVAGVNPHLQKITFFLNSSVPLGDQTITVTTGGKTSIQTIPLKVTANNIYFADANATAGTGTLIDPWLNPLEFTSIANAGDVLYCRAGTFTERISDGNSVWYIRDNPSLGEAPSLAGTVTDPIGICAYPNELPTINAPDPVNAGTFRGITCALDYYTFSGFRITSTGLGIDAGYGYAFADGHRVIGCDVTGCITSDSSGHIVTNGSNSMILGNYCHGGRSANKLDHAIYPAGDASRGGCHIAWNYIADNNFDTGPLISINHQDDRIPADKFCKSHYVYGNFLDSSAFPCSGITVYDLSYDVGDTGGEPEPAYIFNNVLVKCGVDRTYPAMSQWGAHAKWFNNTLIDTIGTCFDMTNARVLSCEFKNNILHCQTGHTYEYVREINLDPTAQIDIDTNVYYNSTGGLTDPLVADPNGITTDPVLVADLVNATITQAAWTQTGGLTVAVDADYNAIDRAGVYGLGAIA